MDNFARTLIAKVLRCTTWPRCPIFLLLARAALQRMGRAKRMGIYRPPFQGSKFVTASGEVLKLSRVHDRETFPGAVVGLGALGVITRITLDIQPTYTMRRYVYETCRSLK
jgi:hypothetical protein